MKPRKALPRRTELRSTTTLKRAELKRSAVPLQSRARIESGPVKARRSGRQSAEEKALRLLLPKRSGGVCETQVPGECTGRGQVVSHRLRRTQSCKAAKWSAVNTLHSCLPCEMYLTDNGGNAKAQSFGWTVSAKKANVVARQFAAAFGPDADPIVFALSRIPVYRRGVYVWLTEGGGVIELDLMEVAEWVGAA